MAIFWLPSLVMFLAVLPHGLCRITNDELIANSLDSSEDMNFNYDPGTNEVKVEMDVIMTLEEYNDFYGRNEDGSRKKRSAVIFNKNTTKHLWPNNRVYYEFEQGIFSHKDIQTIKYAMAEYELYTCLTFEHNNYAGNRIQFTTGNGCASRIGMIPYAKKVQHISLGSNCRFKGTVMHELGHALGLFHEQARGDRDNYVEIQTQNIQELALDQFDKLDFGVSLNDIGVPYDYMSIMHYGKTYWSINGGVTLRTKDPKYQNLIGQIALSFYDIKTMNLLYKCHTGTTTCLREHTECPHEGFVGKDCQCWCQGAINAKNENPVVKCSDKYGAGATPEPTLPPPTESPEELGCKDLHISCGVWAAKGECDSNPKYMHKACKRSCKICECKDLDVSNCPAWAAQGECESNPIYMTKNCEKSCKICNDCEDLNSDCPFWAAQGECSRNPEFMLPSCQESCGGCKECHDLHEDCPAWSTQGECAKNPIFMLTSCKKSCDACGGCKDLHISCGVWAAKGECDSNPKYMHKACKRSCKICDCKDTDPSCPIWAHQGECTKNPVYMHASCKRSCKLC